MKMISVWYFFLFALIIVGNINGVLPGMLFGTNFLTVKPDTMNPDLWNWFYSRRVLLIIGSLSSYLALFLILITFIIRKILKKQALAAREAGILKTLYPTGTELANRKDIMHAVQIDDETMAELIERKPAGYSMNDTKWIIKLIRDRENKNFSSRHFTKNGKNARDTGDYLN